MRKNYDDNSKDYAKWTTKKLKDEARAYYQMIYQVECFNVRDIITYDGICEELYNRGIEPKNKIYF